MRKCIISSPVATQSGYGYHAREFISNVIEQKQEDWDIKLLSMPWGNTPFTAPVPNEWAIRFIPLPINEQPDIWVQITVPNEFQAVGKYNIGVTAATEGDICPKEWIEKINQMQLIVVPSQFTKQVFLNTAEKHNLQVTTNIQVISEYFNKSIYSTNNKRSDILELNTIPETFCYLSVGHWLQGHLGEDRKNISGLLNVFLETFKNKTKCPGLILKTGGATNSITDRWEIESKINQIRELLPKNTRLPNVYLLHGELSDDEMNALYNHPKVKAMISLTKGEGFGRPLLEFSTTNKPIIAPHHSGQADFLSKEHIIRIPGGLTPIHPTAQSQFLIGEAKWFTPDYGYVRKVLKEVYKHYNKFLPNAREQKKFAQENFSIDAVKKQYTKLIKIIDSGLGNVPEAQKLKLPELKKSAGKLELPKIKLPKLKEV